MSDLVLVTVAQLVEHPAVGGISSMVEHLPVEQVVGGSSPLCHPKAGLSEG